MQQKHLSTIAAGKMHTGKSEEHIVHEGHSDHWSSTSPSPVNNVAITLNIIPMDEHIRHDFMQILVHLQPATVGHGLCLYVRRVLHEPPERQERFHDVADCDGRGKTRQAARPHFAKNVLVKIVSGIMVSLSTAVSDKAPNS